MEILCGALVVILTHLVTCFPGIECGSGVVSTLQNAGGCCIIWIGAFLLHLIKFKLLWTFRQVLGIQIPLSFLNFPHDKERFIGINIWIQLTYPADETQTKSGNRNI